MEMICEKCGASADVSPDPMAECPGCGAIYAKVREHREKLAAKAAADVQAKADAEVRREAQRAHYAAQDAARVAKSVEDKKFTGMVCTACGERDAAVYRAPGEFRIELALWMVGLLTCFFIIGIPILMFALGYSIWRMVSRRNECVTCGSTALVPAKSPKGRELMERYQTKPVDS